MEGDHLGDTGVNGRNIFRLFFWEVRCGACTSLMWLRQGQVAGT